MLVHTAPTSVKGSSNLFAQKATVLPSPEIATTCPCCVALIAVPVNFACCSQPVVLYMYIHTAPIFPLSPVPPNIIVFPSSEISTDIPCLEFTPDPLPSVSFEPADHVIPVLVYTYTAPWLTFSFGEPTTIVLPSAETATLVPLFEDAIPLNLVPCCAHFLTMFKGPETVKELELNWGIFAEPVTVSACIVDVPVTFSEVVDIAGVLTIVVASSVSVVMSLIFAVLLTKRLVIVDDEVFRFVVVILAELNAPVKFKADAETPCREVAPEMARDCPEIVGTVIEFVKFRLLADTF